MKKRKKIILWIAVIVLVLCSITALSIKPDIDASGKDLFLYRMSGFSLFLIWLFGLIIELDVFHIKKNILLVKSDRISLHIIFWIILIFRLKMHMHLVMATMTHLCYYIVRTA